MSFNSELEQLRKKKKECLAEARDIDVQKEAALDSAIKAINDKFSEASKEKYRELEAHNNDIDAYCSEVAEYSFFSDSQIGNAIASLMRVFEGVNYIYQEGAFYFTSEIKESGKSTVRKHPRIVVREDSKLDTYLDNGNGLNSLVKNGKAIVLIENADSLEKGIPFYHANGENHSLEQCVKFGRFSYVKEFIDVLVDYKIENGKMSITDDELECLEVDFISERVEQIQENYTRMSQQQEEEMRKKLAADNENRQATLQKVLARKPKKSCE